MRERLDDEALDAIASPHQPDYDSVGGCTCAESYPCSTLGLVGEVRALRAERDRLRDGIAAHREGVRRSVPDGEWLAADERLWSLLDGEADDE